MKDRLSNDFLKLIDERIAAYIKNNNSNIVYKYPAVVTGFDGDKVTVKIPGHDDCEFRFLNKSNVVLNKNDSVFVEAVGANLTNGFISEKFGK